MMQWTIGAFSLSLALLACGGRYDIGKMDSHDDGSGGSSARAGSASVGGSSVATAGASTVAGGLSSPSQPLTDELGPQCVPPGAPPALMGPFAAPAVVWSRIAKVTWGDTSQMMTPPFGLPETTTEGWAGSMVTFVIKDMRSTPDGSRGVANLLQQWFELEPPATFEGPWADELLKDEPALNGLLLTVFDGPRIGIFTEPAWLAQHGSISRRGTVVQRALFGQDVPTPPAGALQMLPPDATLPDREALEKAIANPVCSTCHQIMDPAGWALGHYDAQGAYRELDHGKSVDVAGTMRLFRGDLSLTFDGIKDLDSKLVSSCTANMGFADAFLRLAVTVNGAPPDAESELIQASSDRVRQAFINGGRTYEALVKAYIQSPAGLYP